MRCDDSQVIPRDTFMVEALWALIKQYQWGAVAALIEDCTYGRNIAELLSKDSAPVQIPTRVIHLGCCG